MPESSNKYQHYLKKIEENKSLNSFLRVFPRADYPEKNMVIAVKDNICLKNKITTCGSKLLENFIAPYDATVIKKLKDNSCNIIGKTNLDEFGMGSSGENSAFGNTINPVLDGFVPGGSSSGSASAVAAGLCDGALGSETGGSIRQPASFCGIVGYKPTYGRVSRFGLIAFASSLDQVGVLARDVETTARIAVMISGFDKNDSTSVNIEVPEYKVEEPENTSNLKFSIPDEYKPDNLHPLIKQALDEAQNRLKIAGIKYKNSHLPHLKYATPAYYIIANAEASSNLARFDGGRYGLRINGKNLGATFSLTRSQLLGEEVKRRILLGTYVLSAGYYDQFYRKAQLTRQIISTEFSALFESGINFILAPVTPSPPFRFGEKLSPVDMYKGDIFTTAVNLAGLPAIAVPVKISDVPSGVQIIGNKFDEELLFKIARIIERGN